MKQSPGTDFMLRLDGVLAELWDGTIKLDIKIDPVTIGIVTRAVVAQVRRVAGEIAERVDSAWIRNDLLMPGVSTAEGFSDLLSGKALEIYQTPVSSTVVLVDSDGNAIEPSADSSASERGDRRYAVAQHLAQVLEVSAFEVVIDPDPSAMIKTEEQRVLERIASVFAEGARRGLFTTGVLHPTFRLPLAVVDMRQRWIYGLPAMSLRSMAEINADFGFEAVTPEGELPKPWPDPLPWEERL